MSTIKRFISEESGATAIEYGLIAAIIAVGIIAALQGLRNNLRTVFTDVGNRISSNTGNPN